jgi:hypothetical protein
VPGLDPEAAAQIERKCTPDNPDFTDELTKPLHVYNHLVSPTGTFSLLYNDEMVVLCGTDSRLPGGGGGGYGNLDGDDVDWLPGDLIVDTQFVEPGGVSAYDGKTTRPARQLLQVVAGRVSRRVAKVIFVGPGGSTTTVTPVNGTFIVLNYVEKASKQEISAADSGASVVGRVRAFDAAGRLLAEPDPNGHVGCFLLPDGTTTYGGKPHPGESCTAATRWQR